MHEFVERQVQQVAPALLVDQHLARVAHDLLHRLDVETVARHLRRLVVLGDDLPEARGIAFRPLDDAVKASQDRERQKNEGQAYANDVIPKARGTAARLVQEAEGYRQRVIERAEGDAARFSQVVAEYNKAPQVTRDRLYIEAMQQIMSNTSKVLVDQKGGNNLLYLPLDKLMQVTPGAAAGEAAAKPPEAAPPEPTTARSRDAFRSRERESRP